MITKKAIGEYVKEKLTNSKAWQLQALVRIFEFQTASEQASGETSEENGVGFTGADGEILTSLALQFQKRGSLSPKQLAIVQKKMKKYWKQIIAISDEEKLLRCMVADGKITDGDYFEKCL